LSPPAGFPSEGTAIQHLYESSATMNTLFTDSLWNRNETLLWRSPNLPLLGNPVLVEDSCPYVLVYAKDLPANPGVRC
jgi:hypothetical protein